MTRKKPDRLPDEGLLFVARGDYDALKPSFDFIPGMLHDSTVAIIYGPPGSGKTFFALHLLCSAAIARPLFGVAVEKRCGLYVGLEGEASIKARIQAFCVTYEVEDNPIDYALGSFSLANDDDIAALIEEMQEREIQFVVIDTLSIAMAGLDEISGQHMTHVIEKLHRIKRETGACVVALAHTGKNEKAGIRGHSSQLGNVDTTIEIVVHNKERVGDGAKAKEIEYPVTLATPRSANVRKQRDGESGGRWLFTLALQQTAMKDARGGDVRSPALQEAGLDRFRDCDAEEGAEPLARDTFTARERAALAIITRHIKYIGPLTKDAAREAVRREKWGPENASSWRSAWERFAAKLELDSNGSIEHVH